MNDRIRDIVTREAVNGTVNYQQHEGIYLIREYIKDVKGVTPPEFTVGSSMLEATLFDKALTAALMHFADRINNK